MRKSKLIVLLGHPGSGKGTQGRILSAHFRLPYIATGDLVRLALKRQDTFGKAMKARYKQGIPQPDAVIARLIQERLRKADCRHGIVFDNYPFSLGQIRSFEKIRTKFGFSEPVVLFLKISKKEVVRRITRRKFCLRCNISYLPTSKPALQNKCAKCHAPLIIRSDDQPKIVRHRFEEYQRRLKPVLAHFKKKRRLKIINGERPVGEIAKELRLLI